jgi:hypothetical protein
MPVSAHAALPPPPAVHRFDWRLYESWVRAHHHPGIPLTRFSWPWMQHRRMCGGAVSGEIFNRTTLSYIQDFDHCWAVWTVISAAPRFSLYASPGLFGQNAEPSTSG